MKNGSVKLLTVSLFAVAFLCGDAVGGRGGNRRLISPELQESNVAAAAVRAANSTAKIAGDEIAKAGKKAASVAKASVESAVATPLASGQIAADKTEVETAVEGSLQAALVAAPVAPDADSLEVVSKGHPKLRKALKYTAYTVAGTTAFATTLIIASKYLGKDSTNGGEDLSKLQATANAVNAFVKRHAVFNAIFNKLPESVRDWFNAKAQLSEAQDKLQTCDSERSDAQSKLESKDAEIADFKNERCKLQCKNSSLEGSEINLDSCNTKCDTDFPFTAKTPAEVINAGGTANTNTSVTN